jgi:3-hydroxyisobutyrate dehydrogenase-like beta-hydroxyacid dehydrogenase
MSELELGFVGLGQMGALMATHLVDWPGGLLVYDVRPDAADALVTAGAQRAKSLADVAAQCDLVSIMVRDDEQVRAAVDEMVPHLRRGSAVAVHSTIRASTAVDVAARLNRDGVDLLDAPVSGGVTGAREGRLAVMVGADRAAYERCKPAFRPWADLVVHIGPVGAGTRAKLARNLVSFVSFCAATEAQRLAAACDVDLHKLGAVVRHTDAITGGPGSIMVRDAVDPLAADDPLRDVFEHTRELGEKDLALALELGSEAGVELPFAQLALAKLAAGLGLADEEM